MKMRNLHHYIQDYMGNNRMVVNRDGTIEQITHYYPYGGVIGDISMNESLQKFKFEGKELDRTFGLDNYDIQARSYFAMAPMWDRSDPKAEDYYGISPYVYCGGDPVNRGDFDGKKPSMKESARMNKVMYGEIDDTEIGGGWCLVCKLSEQEDGYAAGLFMRVLSNGENEWAYCFRGTQDDIDWHHNIYQLAGLSSQYTKAMLDGLDLNRSIKDEELTFVGHSKAGGQAQAAALATGRDAVVLNSVNISNITKKEAKILKLIGVLQGDISINSHTSIESYKTTWDILSNSPFGYMDLDTMIITVPLYRNGESIQEAVRRVHSNDNFDK